MKFAENWGNPEFMTFIGRINKIINMKYLFYFSLLILLSACQQAITGAPDTGRKIVINGLITTNSLFNVRIDESDSLTEFDEYPIAPNSVKIYVYQNNIYIDSLYSFPNDPTWSIISPGNYWSKSVVPIAGKEYKIVAKAPGLPDATATTTIPNMVRIESVDTSRIAGINKNPSNPLGIAMGCNIEFDDPANEANYYMLFVERRPSSEGAPTNSIEKITIDSQDPIVEEKISDTSGNKAIAFTDRIINGKKHRLAVYFDIEYFGYPYIPGNEPQIKTFYFRLYSISSEFFNYIHTLNLYNKNYGNPLADPVITYSNITGGYGIFSGAAVSSDSIVWNYNK